MQHDMESKEPSFGPGGSLPDLQVRTVVAIFEQHAAAERAYQALQAGGFATEDISLLQHGEGGRREFGVEHTAAGKTTVAGVSAGVVIGGIAGLVALAIPGIGPLLAVGPITFALGGAGIGGALGGLVGSLAGLGIPDAQAREYEQAVRQGGTFLAVRVAKSEVARAEAILREQGARQTADYAVAV